MELTDPVVAYTAATNVEAQLVKLLLTEAGIGAGCVGGPFARRLLDVWHAPRNP